MSQRTQRTVVYCLLGCLVAFIVWRQQVDTNELHKLIRSEQFDDREEDALACVRAYAGREDSRDMAEKTYRRNAETLISFFQPDLAIEQRYRSQVENDVAEIRAELPDPDCDLAQSKTVIKNQERP